MAGIGPRIASALSRALPSAARQSITATGSVVAPAASAELAPVLDYAVRPALRVLQRRGGVQGGRLAELLVEGRGVANQEAGNAIANVRPLLAALDATENAQLGQALLGAPASGRVAQVLQTVEPFFKSVAQSYIKVGNQRVPAIPQALHARAQLLSKIPTSVANDGKALLNILTSEGIRVRMRALIAPAGRKYARDLRQTNRGLGRFADTLMDRVLDPELDQTRVVDALRNMQVITLMGRAVVQNASQSTISAITAGVGPTIKALRDMVRSGGYKAADDAALRFGVAVDSAMDDFLRFETAGGITGKLARGVLTGTGFQWVERFNRRLAASIGSHLIDDSIRAAQNGSDEAITQLKRLGLNPSEILKRGGITPDETARGVRNFVRRTQFVTAPEELPLLASSGLGRLLYQFKTFSIKAAENFMDEVRVNPIQFARRAVVMAPIPGALVELGRLASSTPPRQLRKRIENEMDAHTPLGHAMRFAANVGISGIFFDAIRSAGFGVEGISEFLLGPTASTAMEGITAMTRLAPRTRAGQPVALEERAKPLGRFALQRIPVLGPTIRRGLLPPREAKPKTSTLRSTLK